MPASWPWIYSAVPIFLKHLPPEEALELIKELKALPAQNKSLSTTLDRLTNRIIAMEKS